ncbi:choice-of-anchor Q domain-containing protein [Phnomibacter ginsenosidimutans]|uniref:DUF1565 domain-containing protein n=1 Tax=Phnomibacter ginsenosidimutans TaxID=2676868 RepID=A0A6I6G9N6_9BACT|nr:choice-of-anchor Q domain-containing protein [Phnomibacter ginsenosidimutans]QGW26750.1 hypothetical protein GLV81_00295 [Phnomibacter ginsenosidimutans]
MQNPKRFQFSLYCLLFFFSVICFSSVSAKIIYVKTDGSNANVGNSWVNAYQTIQHAINAAVATDEIWVAAGTYKPTTTADRTISFVLKNGVAMYGGFTGTETQLNQRNHLLNETILSGEIGAANNNSDNTLRVVVATDAGNGTVLDGFTITGGNANADPSASGGGLYIFRSTLTVARCKITANNAADGGGVANVGGAPVFFDCRFTGNTSTFNGGGMRNDDSKPTLDNCIVSGNLSASGGGMSNFSLINNTNPIIRNTVFLGNHGSGTGGAISNLSTSPVIVNCSFSGNSAPNTGGGVFNNVSVSEAFSAPVLTNCIIWGNSSIFSLTGNLTTITYSIVQGGFQGTGNLNLNPLFLSQPPIGLGSTGDLRVQTCSRAVNGGLNSANPTQIDPVGNPRIVLGTIDMGAYEVQSQPDCCPPGNVLYVNASATGSNNGHSWANALTSIGEALQKSDHARA